MPDSWMLAISDTGYTNDEIAYQWLLHFDHYSKKRQIGRYRLLLDNHGSHLTYNFIKYCEENGILPFALPPHTTHILQPLDGKPFQQYKHYHGKAVNQAARYGQEAFEKREFLKALPRIRANALRSTIIQSGFSDRGIYPFNPGPVIKKLEDLRPAEGPVLQMWDGGIPADRSTPISNISSDGSSPKNLHRLRDRINKAQSASSQTQRPIPAFASFYIASNTQRPQVSALSPLIYGLERV